MAIELIPVLTSDDPPEIDPDGNTYADLNFASAYFDAHPCGTEWPQDDEQQARLLLAAMRLLQMQRFVGVPFSTTQPQQFPRVSEEMRCDQLGSGAFYDGLGRYWAATEIPLPLKQAQCEVALAMAMDDSYNDGTMAQTKLQAGGFEMDYRKRAGALPNAARERLRGLLLVERGAYR